MFDWSQNPHSSAFHTCDRRESKYAEVLVGLPLSVMISISRGWGVVPKQKRWEKGMYTFCIRVCVLGILKAEAVRHFPKKVTRFKGFIQDTRGTLFSGWTILDELTVSTRITPF